MAKVAIVLGVLCSVFGVSRVASADGPAAGQAPDAKAQPAEAHSEVIEVHGHTPFDAPTPKADQYKIPPYSDELVLGNHWARAWLLLDVDARGVVTRMKFLKRPGYKLDDIAVKWAFGLRFDPARDPNGVPRQSYIVFPLEWPSLEWLQSKGELAVRMPTLPAVPYPDQVGGLGGGLVTVGGRAQPALAGGEGTSFPGQLPDSVAIDGVYGSGYPACSEGTAMNLDRAVQVNRDCSQPDMRMAATEPWIERGADTPMPSVAEAPVLDPAKFHRDQLTAVRHTRIAAIVTAGVAIGLATGTTLAYLRFNNASNRVDYDLSHPLFVSASQAAADRSHMVNWELASVGLLAGAAVSGVASVHLWMHPPPVTVMPRAEGGVALSYSGQF